MPFKKSKQKLYWRPWAKKKYQPELTYIAEERGIPLTELLDEVFDHYLQTVGKSLTK
jgi:hypothetical protein